MTTRTLKIVIDQEGGAAEGISSIADAVQGIGGPAASGSAGIAAIGTAAVAAAAVGVVALLGIGAALVGIADASVDAWANFDAASDAIIVGTGASGEALAEMEASVLSLSESTEGLGHSQETIGATLAEVNTRLGLQGDALENTTGQILQYARVTGQDAVQATADVTRLMGDWSVESENAGEVLDKLTKAGQDSGVAVDKLANSLVQSGAPLRQMGFSLDESIALMSKWEKEGVNTDTILSSLRIGVTRFSEAQAEAGVTGEALSASFQSLLDRIAAAPSEVEAVNLAVEALGAKAGPDFAAAVREGRFEFDSYLQSIQNSGGTLQDVADRTIDFTDKIPLLWTKVTNSLIPVGQAIMDIGDSAFPILESAFETVASFISTTVVPIVQSLSAEFQRWITEITPGVQESLGGLQAKFGEWASYIISDILPGVLELANTLWGYAVEIVPGVIDVFTRFANALKTALWPGIMAIWESLGNLASAFGFATGETTGASTALGILEGILSAVVIVVGIVSTALKVQADVFNVVAGIVRGVGTAIEFLGDTWRTVSDAMSEGIDFVSEAWDAFKEIALGAINAIPDAIKAALRWIKDFATSLAEVVVPSWLMPGSPTPFEIGLRGIGAASRDAGRSLTDSFGGIAQGNGLPAIGGGASAGGGVVINLTYSPAVSLATEFELTEALRTSVGNLLREKGIVTNA